MLADLVQFLVLGRLSAFFNPLLVSSFAAVDPSLPCVATRAARAARPVPFLDHLVALDRTEPITLSGDD